ncbi:two-component system chemotaxis response regulator CheY [Oxalobacteraceae bacterium GrIS 1.11]
MAVNKEVGVLIADDETAMRDLLGSILRSYGYTQIEFAADGSRALDVLGKDDSAVELAFLDISMPELSGIDVMMRIQAMRPDCFCVIVSAHSDMDSVLAALGAGARGFVVKPFNANKIAEVLRKYEREMAH